MKAKSFKRLRENRGESLLESLVTMLIVSVAALMLAGAIVSAGRTNAGTQKIVTFPRYQDGEEQAYTLSGDPGSDRESMRTYAESVRVTQYTDAGGMVYYEIG